MLGEVCIGRTVLDKVDGWKVVHQLEMILVQGCRDLFNKNLKLKF